MRRSFLSILLGVVVLAGAVVASARLGVGRWIASRVVHAVERTIREQSEAISFLRARDTEGGATPEETLARYLAALEKGDYAAAARLFIEDARTREEASLRQASPADIATLRELIRGALAGEGSYSPDRAAYTIRAPIFIDFVRYPSGVWKFVEI